jgi:hypothetical protein
MEYEPKIVSLLKRMSMNAQSFANISRHGWTYTNQDYMEKYLKTLYDFLMDKNRGYQPDPDQFRAINAFERRIYEAIPMNAAIRNFPNQLTLGVALYEPPQRRVVRKSTYNWD